MSEQEVATGPRSIRILATFVGGLSAGLDFMMVMAVMPAIAAVYEDKNIYGGLLVFCKYLTQMCTNPFAAYSVQRYGPWPTGIVGLFIYSLSTAVFAVSSEIFGLLCVSMVFQGIGAALLFNGTQEAMLRHYPVDLQGDAVSYGMVGLSLGLFTGPIYGGVMYDLIGFQWAFLLVAFGFFFLFGGALLCYRNSLFYGIPGPSMTNECIGESEKKSEIEFLSKFLNDNYNTVTTNQKLLLVFCTFIVETTLWSMIMNVETFYLEREDWTASSTGLMLSVVSFFYGVISFLSGPIYRHARYLIIAGPYPALVCLGFCVPFIGLTTSIGLLVLINFICGTMIGIVELTSIYNFRILLNDSPIAFSLTDVCFCFGGMSGALVGSALNDALPSTFAAFLVLGLVGVCFGLPACYLAWQFHRDDWNTLIEAKPIDDGADNGEEEDKIERKTRFNIGKGDNSKETKKGKNKYEKLKGNEKEGVVNLEYSGISPLFEGLLKEEHVQSGDANL